MVWGCVVKTNSRKCTYNVEALFKAAADVGDAVEIALWGSIGAPPDDSTDDLRDYLDSVYTPVVQRYCSPTP